MAALKWRDFENAIRESVYHAVTEVMDGTEKGDITDFATPDNR